MAIRAEVQQKILEEYERTQPLYNDFCNTLSRLIESILRGKGIRTHSVSFRTKLVESLTEKIARPDKTYNSLEDITDLAGVRITTYFAEDVDKAADVLSDEFVIDKNASVDKRRHTAPDRFGYSSLHYVMSFGASRANLAEYKKFGAMKCEVQIRSILQHAWAEIEHDLGYKSAAGVPVDLRRKFARIASLLELADDEFDSIRHALASYERALPEKIRIAPQTVDLDLPALKALYLVPSAALSLDNVVSRAAGFQVKSNMTRGEVLLERLHSLGIRTVDVFERTALAELATVEAFARYWNSTREQKKVAHGVGIFYLLYVLAWKTRDRARVLSYLTDNHIGKSSERSALADRVLAFDPKDYPGMKLDH